MQVGQLLVQSTLATSGKKKVRPEAERGAGYCSRSAPRKNPRLRWCTRKGREVGGFEACSGRALMVWIWAGYHLPRDDLQACSGATLCVLYPKLHRPLGLLGRTSTLKVM